MKGHPVSPYLFTLGFGAIAGEVAAFPLLWTQALLLLFSIAGSAIFAREFYLCYSAWILGPRFPTVPLGVLVP